MKTEDLMNERENTYGDFEQTGDISLALVSILRSHHRFRMDASKAEAIELICVKLAMIVCGDPNDPEHWVDIAGYAMLGIEKEGS